MENKNTRLQYLLDQYLADAVSEDEKAELWDYINDPAYQSDIEHLLSMAFENQAKEDMGQAQQSELLQAIFDKDNIRAERRSYRRIWINLASAAAVTLILISVGLFYLPASQKADERQTVYTSDVDPGTTSATLILADGKRIRLSEKGNGSLAEEAGVKIKKAANGEVVYEIADNGTGHQGLHTLSTANGETYKVTLPDGSRVWLNSASSLTFNPSMKHHKKRVVKLNGEAYFEIEKDKLRPFIVKTAQQQVEVLGTHFNINSYTDESFTATTLLEGSVKVSSNMGNQVLKPGQQSQINDRRLTVNTVNPENVIAWKNGDFALNSQNFKTALRKIARWYDVEVIYDSSIPDDIESGGWISRKAKLSSVLKSIESTGQVRFRIEDKKIYVSKY